MEALTRFFLDRLDELEFGAKHRSAHHVGCDRARCDCRVSEYLLADVEAKRRIVERAQFVWKHSPTYADGASWRIVERAQFVWKHSPTYADGASWRMVLRLLVQPFDFHPDYQAEWKP